MFKQKINPKGSEKSEEAIVAEIKSLAIMANESVASGRSLLISKSMIFNLVEGKQLLKKKFRQLPPANISENRIKLRKLVNLVEGQIISDINGFRGNRFKNINAVVSYLQRLDEEKKSLRPAKIPSDQRVTSKVVEHSEKISALAADKRLFYERIHRSIATSYTAMS